MRKRQDYLRCVVGGGAYRKNGKSGITFGRGLPNLSRTFLFHSNIGMPHGGPCLHGLLCPNQLVIGNIGIGNIFTLESFKDSKTPRLPAAKAMIVRLWNCGIVKICHYGIMKLKADNSRMSQCHNAIMSGQTTEDKGSGCRVLREMQPSSFVLNFVLKVFALHDLLKSDILWALCIKSKQRLLRPALALSLE